MVAATAAAGGGSPGAMKLHMMTDRGLDYDGAVCLDGSDTG